MFIQLKPYWAPATREGAGKLIPDKSMDDSGVNGLFIVKFSLILQNQFQAFATLEYLIIASFKKRKSINPNF